jgi:hypothetical protein
MSQTQAIELASGPTIKQRINFSDGNRALHQQALFAWLPDNLRDAALIDWTQLPSHLIGYFVNTVGDSPWACSLALAAGVGRAAMNDRSLTKSIEELHLLLRSVQNLYGIEQVTGLTKSVWESYITQKELVPVDYLYFKSYAAFTESHLRDHVERLSAAERTKIAPYVLPRLPRGFRRQYLSASKKFEGEKRRRKAKSDVLAPLHTLLISLVRFRKQSAGRLLSAYREARALTKKEDLELPLLFSYEEELVTVNSDARTVAEVRLEKRSVTLRFLLWDRRTWVLKHPNDYQYDTRRRAALKAEEFA